MTATARTETPRRGFALVIALGAIVVIGVLIGGVFFSSTQEVRIGEGTVVQERAFRAAELGLNSALSTWDNLAIAGVTPGTIVTETYAGENWVDTVRITKLNSTTYSLVSTAFAGTGTRSQARKSTGLGVAVVTADLEPLGAVTARGDITIGGSSYITGFDKSPDTWTDCPALADTLAGLTVGTVNNIKTSGCTDWSCVDGDPEILATPKVNDTTTYFTFGDFDWVSLTAIATKVYTQTVTLTGIGPVIAEDGSCATGVNSNWGAPVHTSPAGACEQLFPIIHAKGAGNTLHISGGRGQGILLVDGDLELSGGFEFYGPVIVRGALKTTGTGGKINGAIMVANLNLAKNTILGDATIRYSTCAIEKALAAAASPRRLIERAWVDIH